MSYTLYIVYLTKFVLKAILKAIKNLCCAAVGGAINNLLTSSAGITHPYIPINYETWITRKHTESVAKWMIRQHKKKKNIEPAYSEESDERWEPARIGSPILKNLIIKLLWICMFGWCPIGIFINDNVTFFLTNLCCNSFGLLAGEASYRQV
jgi:hypothetical protein